MKNNIFDNKIALRKKQLVLRKKLFANVTQYFNKNLFDRLIEKINFKNMKSVSSFISINTEINTNKLNSYILSKNKTLCLPVIIKKNDHLTFRQFTKFEDMIDGFMKIKEPPITNKVISPELLFVPCLAFDLNGFRLGYGGGYYDKTLNYLKKNKKKPISVGYAFDDQKVLEVPKDNFDMKLDYVITEKKLYNFL